VGKKIERQLKAWRRMGHEARLFMHLPRSGLGDDLVSGDVFPYGPSHRATQLRTEFERAVAARRVVAAVRVHRPDIIYLRYGIYVFPVHRLMSVAPTVEEVNTNDLTQHEGLGGSLALYNRLTRGLLLGRVSGLITVSHELANCAAFASYRKPTCVIANGIDLESYQVMPPPNNQTPRLAFIGNPGYTWHGVDKLVALARAVPDIQLDIIGYEDLPELRPLPPNLRLHGYLRAEAYYRVLGAADAAISSLALHRIKLEEASPLKSRECLALGLPLILAYTDTDLSELDCEFLLRIPNTEDNIATHGLTIREFAYRMRGKRADPRLIFPIDQRSKEVRRISFFRETLECGK